MLKKCGLLKERDHVIVFLQDCVHSCLFRCYSLLCFLVYGIHTCMCMHG